MPTNLRRTFRSIQKNWGHDVLLQRRLGDVIDDSSPRPKFSERLERHTVRRTFARGSAGLTTVTAESTEGLTNAVDMIYYFAWDVGPKEGDRIYEKDARYPSGMETYLADFAVPMYGKGGRIEYYEVGATRETPV